jgi:F1F0 ATPase subunit 2
MLVRLEMDEERMNFPVFDSLSGWGAFLSLVAHLIAGIMLGVLYFRSLWLSTHRFIGGGRMMAAIALMIGRFGVLLGLLTLTSLEGTLPLLTAALGVLISRPVVVGGIRKDAL